jgi:lysophospholipase L1-like esterase
VLAVLLPFVLLAVVEVGLRAAWPAGARAAAFERAGGNGAYLIPNRAVARRYFAAAESPPAPPVDRFSVTRPDSAFRVFVLGESTAGGFPYPANGTFSRFLRDALTDVLPGYTVEVVNLGIAATNSYAVADLAADVVEQRPDAVLIYAGHNEYYGALGVGSAVGVGSARPVVRAYLAAQHLRTFMALRAAAMAVMARTRASHTGDSATASVMETIARNQAIGLHDDDFKAGLGQYRANIGAAVRIFRRAEIPVYLASIASNVRSQAPFVSPHNAPAVRSFAAGQAALARGDTAGARALLLRARDEDVVRFRAPSALNGVIREVAAAEGARYVGISEAIDSASPGRIPGNDLFLEHVHPNARGYALIGKGFFEALQRDAFLGRTAQMGRLGTWGDYGRRMELTGFDHRLVHHSVQTIVTRWPFVARDRAVDYRGTYRPAGLVDSLALLVSRGGASWGEAKLRVATAHELAGRPDSALAEYRGLVRDAPWREPPNRLAGRALVRLQRPDEAIPFLARSMRLVPTSEAAYLLGRIALERHQLDAAIALLDRAVQLAPGSAEPVYRLSLAFGLSRNLAAARGTAARVAQLAPRHPGLAEWMRTLGMPPP